MQPQIQLPRVWHLIGGDQPWTEHSIAIDRLAKALELWATQRHVQRQAVSRHMGHRIGGFDLAASFANHHRELDLVVVASFGKTQNDFIADANQRGASLEEHAPIANGGDGSAMANVAVLGAFLRMGFVVDGRANDLARVGHRRVVVHRAGRMLLPRARSFHNAGPQLIQVGNQHIVAGKWVALAGQGLQSGADIGHFLALDQTQTPTIESAQFHG